MNGFRMIPFLSDCPLCFLFPLSFDGALVVGISSPLVVVFFSVCAVDKDVTSGIRAVVMAAVVAGLETNKGRLSPFRIRVRLKRGALGPVRNRKTAQKIMQNRKTEMNFDQNRKPNMTFQIPKL